MPAAARATVGALLRESGVEQGDTVVESMVDIATVDDVLHIGDVSVPIAKPQNPELVPDVVFFEIPSHTLILRSMLKDFQLGEHLLLMGNQGVGKNKLTDHFVKLMQREREYIQLHRDTTVPTLTINPSLEDGRIVWQDSPLVRSMARGRVLVVDEFDKAPVEVVCVLKGLLEDGEILLADGRRFVSAKSVLFELSVDPLGPEAEGASILQIHPDFRVIALANRPGYPFLGNDFFAEMGDVFACHAIDNPDQASEISLLRAYADDVPATTIRQLTAAFVDLRKLSDDGLLAYPYSTRELVNVVRHMSEFPGDSMNVVLQNVFSFDSYDDGLLRMLHDVFRKHGIPVGRNQGGVDEQQTESELSNEHFLPEPVLQVTWHDGDELAEIPFEDWPLSPLALPVVPTKPSDPFGAAAIGQQQIEQLGELTSARSNRFAEEVLGWRMEGTTPCLIDLSRTCFSSVASLLQELQVATAIGCLCGSPRSLRVPWLLSLSPSRFRFATQPTTWSKRSPCFPPTRCKPAKLDPSEYRPESRFACCSQVC
jgi:energy-coupling factor transporter ATP-binding protein EcfA2